MTSTSISKRPAFHTIYMELARLMSLRSTCKRLAVGAVITTTDHRKVLAVGYNGNAKGLPNTCDSDQPGNCGCLHAECNAVINCDSPRDIDKVVYVTHLPCTMCAKTIINLGNVKFVYYKEDYRDMASYELFQKVGIICTKLKELP